MHDVQTLSTADDYWTHVVQADLQEIHDQPDSLRSAMHCAISLFHMSDWIFQTCREQSGAFVFKRADGESTTLDNEKVFANELQVVCEQFGIVRGIANASKHFKLTGRSAQTVSPSVATQTTVKSLGWGEGAWSVGPYGGGPQVMIEVAGHQRQFSLIASQVRDMWLSLNAINQSWNLNLT